jgi:L,D-transpeptidase ErfK/SrfK
MMANAGVDPWLPGADRQVAIPGEYLVPDGPRIGIVINLAEQRLYYFRNGGREVDTYPIGTGADAELTPIGLTHIAAKEPNPVWIPPPSIRAERPDLPARILPGPDNPLGDFALRLGWPTYLIHGTNKPYGVGRHVSHGCIRLYPEDISQLYHEVKVGLPVRVIDEKIRLAWVGEELYLAVFPTRRQVDAIELNKPAEIDLPNDLIDRVAAAARSSLDRIDWRTVDEVGRRRNGIPIQITRAQLSSEADDTFPRRLSRRRLFADKR